MSTKPQHDAVAVSLTAHVAILGILGVLAWMSRPQAGLAPSVFDVLPGSASTPSFGVSGVSLVAHIPHVKPITPGDLRPHENPEPPISSVEPGLPSAHPIVRTQAHATPSHSHAAPHAQVDVTALVEDLHSEADHPAGGRAESSGAATALQAYFATLEAEVSRHEVMSQSPLSCRVAFFVGADGAIGRVRIVRSSGDGAFDQSVVAAFEQTASIGPRPDHRGDEQVVEFRVRDGSL